MLHRLWTRLRTWWEGIREPFDVEDIFRDDDGPWWGPPGVQP